MKPIDILIHNFRRPGYLSFLLQRITRLTDWPHRVIVINNKSNEEMRKLCGLQMAIGRMDMMVNNEKNLTLPNSLKQGFKKVESRVFVTLLDDGMIPALKPCWLTVLKEALEQNKEYAALAFNYNWCKFDKYNPRLKRIRKPEIEEVPVIEEHFRIIRSRDMKAIGFGKGQIDTDTFCNKIRDELRKKVGSILNTGAIVWQDKNMGYPKNYKRIPFHYPR